MNYRNKSGAKICKPSFGSEVRETGKKIDPYEAASLHECNLYCTMSPMAGLCSSAVTHNAQRSTE